MLTNGFVNLLVLNLENMLLNSFFFNSVKRFRIYSRVITSSHFSSGIFRLQEGELNHDCTVRKTGREVDVSLATLAGEGALYSFSVLLSSLIDRRKITDLKKK